MAEEKKKKKSRGQRLMEKFFGDTKPVKKQKKLVDTLRKGNK